MENKIDKYLTKEDLERNLPEDILSAIKFFVEIGVYDSLDEAFERFCKMNTNCKYKRL